MNNRKPINTPLRRAIYEAHGKKCAYTREVLDWSELEIDHVIALEGNATELQRLVESKIISPDFDLNGIENLLPTCRSRNNQKSNAAFPQESVVYFLGIAQERKQRVLDIYNDLISTDRSLNAYLAIKVQASKNDVTIDEMFEYLRHQDEGEVPLRISPEVEGAKLTRANSALAIELMDRPFALGGGSIEGVELSSEGGERIFAGTARQFIEAKAQGFHPVTQFEITCYAMADETSELLRAVAESSFAAHSEIRSPRITLTNLDRWASSWASDCLIEADPMVVAECRSLADLADRGLIYIYEQSQWEVKIRSKFGLSSMLRELMRADLDGDKNEEILVFDYTFAEQGSLRAGVVVHAKMRDDGLLWREELENN